jgi:hypothetical protein
LRQEKNCPIDAKHDSNDIYGKEDQHDDDDLPCQHPEEENGKKYKFSNYVIGLRNNGFCDPKSSHKNANYGIECRNDWNPFRCNENIISNRNQG